jgi:4-amino-4-deoxychorismate lyase
MVWRPDSTMAQTQQRFDLIETMAFDPAEGLLRLQLHLSRLEESAHAFDFVFDRHGLRNELQAATFSLTEPALVRLQLALSGATAIEIRPRPVWPNDVVQVSIVPCSLPASDDRMRHKTSDRRHYAAALAKGGTLEVLLTDAHGYLTEGCYSSLFVERGDRLITPPLTRGLLPGVLRQSLIDMGEAEEGDLRARDLERGFFIGNAARGLVAATLVAPRGGGD